MRPTQIFERMRDVFYSCENTSQLPMAEKYCQMLINRYLEWDGMVTAIYQDALQQAAYRIQDKQKVQERRDLAMPMPIR